MTRRPMERATAMSPSTRTRATFCLRLAFFWTVFLLGLYLYHLRYRRTTSSAESSLHFDLMGILQRNLGPVDEHKKSNGGDDYPGVFLENDKKETIVPVEFDDSDADEDTETIENFVPEVNVTENDDSDELDHDKVLSNNPHNNTSVVGQDVDKDNSKTNSDSRHVKSDERDEDIEKKLVVKEEDHQQDVKTETTTGIVSLGRKAEPVRLLHSHADQTTTASSNTGGALPVTPEDAIFMTVQDKASQTVSEQEVFEGEESSQGAQDQGDIRGEDDENDHDDDEDEEDEEDYTFNSLIPPGIYRNKALRPAYLRKKNLHWTISHFGEYPPTLFSPPANDKPIQRLPQALIIGAGKCGTRALIEFLRMHPYIVPAGAEIHYFDVDENFKRGREWYRSEMPLSFSNQVTIEKTPSYIWSERAIEEIYKLNSSMKLIVIIKDPVERVVSQAIRSHSEDIVGIFLKRKADGTLEVDEESRTVDWGIYVKYLKMWTKKFPLSQIHVVEAKEFIKNPSEEINKIELFLNVPHLITEDNFHYNASKGFYCMRPFHLKETQCLSGGKGKPHPTLDPEAQKMLYEFYKSHNEELFQFLGRKYLWTPPADVVG